MTAPKPKPNAYYAHDVNNFLLLNECYVNFKLRKGDEKKIFVYCFTTKKRVRVKKWNLLSKENFDREKITPVFI